MPCAKSHSKFRGSRLRANSRGERLAHGRAPARAANITRSASSCSEQLGRFSLRFRCGAVAKAVVFSGDHESMPPAAPRYPEKLLALIEGLDDESLSLAEVARRVGAAAERAHMIRPSPVHVRRLVALQRELRRDEREVRQAAVDALVDLTVGRNPNPFAVVEKVDRARERVEERARRR
jgi:hypothetical protein